VQRDQFDLRAGQAQDALSQEKQRAVRHQQEASEFQASLEAERTTSSRAAEDLRAKKAEKAALAEELQQTKEALQQREEELREAKGAIEDVRVQRDQFDLRAGQAQDALSQEKQRAVRHQQEASEFQASLEAERTTSRRAAEELRAKEAEKAALAEEVRASQHQVSELQDSLRAKDASCAELAADLKAKEGEVTQLQERLQGLEETLSQSAAAGAAPVAPVWQFKNHLNDWQQYAEGMNQELEALHQEWCGAGQPVDLYMLSDRYRISFTESWQENVRHGTGRRREIRRSAGGGPGLPARALELEGELQRLGEELAAKDASLREQAQHVKQLEEQASAAAEKYATLQQKNSETGRLVSELEEVNAGLLNCMREERKEAAEKDETLEERVLENQRLKCELEKVNAGPLNCMRVQRKTAAEKDAPLEEWVLENERLSLRRPDSTSAIASRRSTTSSEAYADDEGASPSSPSGERGPVR